MISTITTATTTILRVPTIARPLVLIGILVLLVLLVGKELATALATARAQKLSQALNIGIIPLLIAFVLIVASRVMDVLSN